MSSVRRGLEASRRHYRHRSRPPIGTGPRALWGGVCRGVSAIRTISRFDTTGISSTMAGEIDFDPLDYMSPKRARRLDRSRNSRSSARGWRSTMLVSPLRTLPTMAPASISVRRWGVAFGEEQHREYVLRGAHHVNPLLALSVFGGAGASNATIELGFTGPRLPTAARAPRG
ncbi:MAG: hypothetical protein R2845_04795 [Thermomicrobiales bacterium]